MANPNASDLYVDPLLSNIASRVHNDSENFIAQKVFPRVPVEKQSGKYHVIEGFKRNQSRPLADNEAYPEGSYQVSQADYSCTEFGESRAVTRNMRANAMHLDPDALAAESLTESLLLGMEQRFADIAFSSASLWGNEVDGYASNSTGLPWDNGGSDPLADLSAMRKMILSQTGRDPRDLVLSYDCYNVLKNHPDIVDRHKYTTSAPIGEQALASLFEVERVHVLKAVIDSSESGATASNGFLSASSGLDALLLFSSGVPSTDVPTAGASFSFDEGMTVRIDRWEEPAKRRSMIGGTVFYDIQIVAPLLGAMAHGQIL